MFPTLVNLNKHWMFYPPLSFPYNENSTFLVTYEKKFLIHNNDPFFFSFYTTMITGIK